MKAVIPVAGSGVALRPHTFTQPKCLLSIAGHPILGVIIDKLIDSGITEFVFVIGYMGSKIIEFVNATYPSLKVTFIRQDDGRGIGSAIAITKDVVAGDDLLIVLGDTVFDCDLEHIIKSNYNYIGISKVNDPRHFGIAECNSQNKIIGIQEKPLIPNSNLALIGVYKIKDSNALYAALESIASQKDRMAHLSLSEGIDRMINDGIEVRPFTVKYWYDCGQKETLLETNTTLLKRSGNDVHTSAQLNNSVIIPPVFIGPSVQIHNSVIGPFASISEGAKIHKSVISNSIIGTYSTVDEAVLRDSLIGGDVKLQGLKRSLNIGDNTEINLG